MPKWRAAWASPAERGPLSGRGTAWGGDEQICGADCGGDIFRIVREDGSEALDLAFERNAAGKVARFVLFSNPRNLIPETGEKTAPAPARRKLR